MHRFQIIVLSFLLALLGCAGNAPLVEESLPRQGAGTAAVADNPVTEAPALTPTGTFVAAPSSPMATDLTPNTLEPVPPTRLPIATTPSTEPTISPEEATAQELDESRPPVRDDVRLAVAFGGLTHDKVTEVALVGGPLPVGEQQVFTVLDVVHNTVSDIDAELLAVGEHAYFWFDKGPISIAPNAAELKSVTGAFDRIYKGVVAQFGSENNPGIDGDPRLHIVHVSPTTLCGVTEETADQCYYHGLVNSTDFLPREVDPRSNEREMFVMNAHSFGTDRYLGVLAHEFRHMIEDHYDEADKDWEIEGSATLAEQLLGLASSGVARGNMFLENPDQQLNSWTDDGTAPFYGQGYLLNRYIYDRLGKDLYLEFATSPYPGLKAVEVIAEAHNLDLSGESLWLDWLVTLAIHNDPQAPEKYQIENAGLNTASMSSLSFPISLQEDVRQYAADYYELPVGTNRITFAGDNEVPLLNTERNAGGKFWSAQRANYSNPRLTRAFDLREIEKATLNYDVYVDIEQGYDFAYVSVSLDGGQIWLPLAGEQMQGLAPADNPAGSALADRFYTGRTRRWLHEHIDLSSFAGQEILLRFEYVTDPILTYGGFAVDDIEIPEIDFFDDVENDDTDWSAEGFTRATFNLPQKWHLQYISHSDQGLSVQTLPVDEQGQLSVTLTGGETKERSILIVAATAPTTLEPAHYEIRIDR